MRTLENYNVELLVKKNWHGWLDFEIQTDFGMSTDLRGDLRISSWRAEWCDILRETGLLRSGGGGGFLLNTFPAGTRFDSKITDADSLLSEACDEILDVVMPFLHNVFIGGKTDLQYGKNWFDLSDLLEEHAHAFEGLEQKLLSPLEQLEEAKKANDELVHHFGEMLREMANCQRVGDRSVPRVFCCN